MTNTESTLAETPAVDTAGAGALDSGTYEIIRKRLQTEGEQLQSRLKRLNQARKETFGSIDTKLLDTNRITTENSCIPRDIISIGSLFIFGYNVHIGLKSETLPADVFAVYEKRDGQFHERALELLSDERFAADFKNLYKYYKNAQFAKFSVSGSSLFMVFRIGKRVTDIKVFKWRINEESLVYVDSRSDHEFSYPAQHEFAWSRTHRDLHREGVFAHIAIEDRLFVQVQSGLLTLKVEDNTDTGEGVYSEQVVNAEQSLDDVEIFYASLGSLIILKIKPYQENTHRFIVYNEKVREARRIDSIKDACVLLPDSHGIIFPDGYYLQSGELKKFELEQTDMVFEKRIPASNGEDYLFVFYNREQGVYTLFSYNLIEKNIESPQICNGYANFPNGRFVIFRTEETPGKHHALQIWQTPYVDGALAAPAHQDSLLYKIGNKDIVRCMSECQETYNLIQREDTYLNLYYDIAKLTGDILDSYFWLGDDAAMQINLSLKAINEASSAALNEFEKVTAIRKTTKTESQRVSRRVSELLQELRRVNLENIDEYVKALAELRALRGETIALRELRYADLPAIDTMERDINDIAQKLSAACVEFLLKPEALAVYENQISGYNDEIAALTTGAQAKDLAEGIDSTAGALELLIDIVSNLKIEDPTQTTQIVDRISVIFGALNKSRATLKHTAAELGKDEAVGEFGAQMKLLEQGILNFLSISDTPEKCDEYLTKLMVQVEELEGRFLEFDEFVIQLTDKREEIYSAFDAKKIGLQEARNKRASALHSSAERILRGIRNRVGALKTINEIHGYFAADVMAEKVLNIIEDLETLGDAVKADDVRTQLKTAKEDAIRQLKDRAELFDDDLRVIALGKHKFSVNRQTLDITIAPKDAELYIHLTGTDFFEKVADPEIEQARDLWDQHLVSENDNVYRAEFLAYKFFTAALKDTDDSLERITAMTETELNSRIQKFMAPRFDEGYVKGVHDHDATVIARAALEAHTKLGSLRYSSIARACGVIYWRVFAEPNAKAVIEARLKGMGAMLDVFPGNRATDGYIQNLALQITEFTRSTRLFPEHIAQESAEYLFNEITSGEEFVVSSEAATLYNNFNGRLREARSFENFQTSSDRLQDDAAGRLTLLCDWLNAYVDSNGDGSLREYVSEAAALLFLDAFEPDRVRRIAVEQSLSGMLGDHPVIDQGTYRLHYVRFMHKMRAYVAHVETRFRALGQRKKALVQEIRKSIRVDEFVPRVLTSFVRNRLLNDVYLPLIGANLAKQIGAAGDQKRTDRMGMLLLISPPGYGKTTLMEYVASRLGLVFMKINGPALGHEVTSLDPAAAPNAAAREELAKLGLAFEMGDNILIYIDDIQHCNPEFLQKFISLTDSQRKIEGVYKDVSKSYDLRGKRVCVAMAGNPYTESGEKFRIPDMLANRADTYNLGDIVGDNLEAFRLSYIENCLTSNPTLSALAMKSRRDIYTLIRLAETDTRADLEFETEYSVEELQDYVAVLKKLAVIRDVVFAVNQEYIRSASQADEYRTEPPFKLQGSYRNMNKLAEKVAPIMNESELQTLILSHYEQESQTLTTGAEANLLKFKELTAIQTEQEIQRWQEIKETFAKNTTFMGLQPHDHVGAILRQLSSFGDGLNGIKTTLEKAARLNDPEHR